MVSHALFSKYATNDIISFDQRIGYKVTMGSSHNSCRITRMLCVCVVVFCVFSTHRMATIYVTFQPQTTELFEPNMIAIESHIPNTDF